MKEGYAQAARFDDAVLAEQFIAGRELTVAVLGTGRSARALPVIEIVAPGGNYDYEHKYFSDETQYFCPADLPDAVAGPVADLAVRAYPAPDRVGLGRLPFLLDAGHTPRLLEAKHSPAITP